MVNISNNIDKQFTIFKNQNMIRTLPSAGGFYVIKTLDPRFLEPHFMKLYDDYSDFHNEVAYDQNGSIISNEIQIEGKPYILILSRIPKCQKEFKYFLTFIKEDNSYNKYVGNNYERAVFTYLDQL